MKNKLFALISTLLLLMFFSCYDVFEEDVSDQRLILKAPHNGAVLSQADVTFWWSTIDGIRGYELVIVNPSFEKISDVIIETILPVSDSVPPENRFIVELDPGTYEWQVKAYNSASETVSDTFKLEVVASEGH